MSDDLQSLDDFRGIARLFPLPNVVLFPSVVQPLHIFEPRYRAMMADALEGDRLLAMALLKPGYEEDYENRPPIHPVACLGRIFNEERLHDGRYNLLLHGLRRVHIDHELPPDRPFREARVRLLEDVPCATSAEEMQLRARMEKMLPAFLAAHGGASDQASKLLASELPLGTLCDIFTFALPLETAQKQQLLEELSVSRRAAVLLGQLDQLAPLPPQPDRRFPPDFSVN
jgi:Lon protease-like protein